jgi:hypothetical protein
MKDQRNILKNSLSVSIKRDSHDLKIEITFRNHQSYGVGDTSHNDD